MRLAAGIAAIATAAVLAACGSGPETTETEGKTVPETSQGDDSSSASATPEEPAEDPNPLSVSDYMEAINTGEVGPLRAAVEEVAAESPAAIYLEHRANVLEARLDGGMGQSFGQSTLNETEGGYEVCTDGDCTKFADFTTDDKDQLVDFTVDGEPIDERLAQGDGKPTITNGGVKITYLTSYKSVQSDAVFVTARIETGNQPATANLFTATYRSPDGKQRTAGDAAGPYEVGANSNAIVYMAFPGLPSGGTVTLDGCIADCMETFEVQIKTK